MGLQDLINKYDNGGFSKTGWFQLKDDGDTATVRLLFLVSTTASPFKMTNRVLKLLIPLTSLLFVINNLITSTKII